MLKVESTLLGRRADMRGPIRGLTLARDHRVANHSLLMPCFKEVNFSLFPNLNFFLPLLNIEYKVSASQGKDCSRY